MSADVETLPPWVSEPCAVCAKPTTVREGVKRVRCLSHENVVMPWSEIVEGGLDSECAYCGCPLGGLFNRGRGGLCRECSTDV